MENNNLTHKLENSGFPLGRMIWPSKTKYLHLYPDNIVVFNAKIYDVIEYCRKKDKEQLLPLWHGDLDLTKDFTNLYKILKHHRSVIITDEQSRKILEVYQR